LTISRRSSLLDLLGLRCHGLLLSDSLLLLHDLELLELLHLLLLKHLLLLQMRGDDLRV